MKIAITGTIGSGKSTFCDYLRELGYHVFDSDKYNANLLKEKSSVYSLIKYSFPEAFEGNILNKQKLANIVFNDSDKKNKLESILHPAIINEIKKESEEYSLFFAEVPLLFESGLETFFDKTILVICDEDIAIKRLVDRGLTKEDAKQRIDSQMPVLIKKNKADYLIYNNEDYQSLKEKANDWLNKYAR